MAFLKIRKPSPKPEVTALGFDDSAPAVDAPRPEKKDMVVPAEAIAAKSSVIQSEQIAYRAEREQGALNIDFYPLDAIDPDPTNPRTRGIDARQLLTLVPKFIVLSPKYAGYSQDAIDAFDKTMEEAVAKIFPVNEEYRERWESVFNDLKPLRDNIRLLGVKQPIEIQKKGNRFTIVYGHRRYLASILAGERLIPARVIDENFKNVKHVQASENIHQRPLTLAQRLEAIEASLRDYNLPTDTKPAIAASLLGFDRSNMWRYLKILDKGSPALRSAIEKGLVSDFQLASDYVGLTDAELQAAIYANAPVDKKAKKVKPTKNAKEGRGAPRKFIVTPKITHTRVIEMIVAKFKFAVPKDIDWENKSDVNVLWESFLKDIERQCLQEK